MKLFSKRSFKDMFFRYYAYYVVIVLGTIFLSKVFFFVEKMATVKTDTPLKVDFYNNLTVEAVVAIVIPVVLVYSLLREMFERESSDVLSTLPVKNTAKYGTITVLLLIVLAALILTGAVTDRFFGWFAANGFGVRFYFLKKYGFLATCFVLSTGISFLAFAGASSTISFIFNVLVYGFFIRVILKCGIARLGFERGLAGEELFFWGDGYETTECFTKMLQSAQKGDGMIALLCLLAPIAIAVFVTGFVLLCKRPAEQAEDMSRCEWNHVVTGGLFFFTWIGCFDLNEALMEFLVNREEAVPQIYRSTSAIRNLSLGFCILFAVLLLLEFVHRRNPFKLYKVWKGFALGLILVAALILLMLPEARDIM